MEGLDQAVAQILQASEDQRVELILNLMRLSGVPGYFMDALPNWVKQPRYINVEFLSCFATVEGVTAVANVQADYYAVNYGIPGIIIGCAWPLIFCGLAMAIRRVMTKPSLRAICLLIAMIGTFAEAAAVSTGKKLKPYEEFPSAARGYITAMMVAAHFRAFFLMLASAVRFSVVYNNATVRRIVVGATCIVAFLGSHSALILGLYQIHGLDRESVTFHFWVLSMICPVTYIIVGLSVFTRALRAAVQAIRTKDDKLTKVQMSNNVLMAVTIGSCVGALIITIVLDVGVSYYVTPVIFLLTTVWAVGENSFEYLTILQTTAGSNKNTNVGIGSKGTGQAMNQKGMESLKRDTVASSSARNSGMAINTHA
ncbi:hypothetical protein BC832DRAFT_317724 [Gaertneriomyces semiglobifer]|nr:hypothetical protein BC832DRAFT_317724 [Gaertneriomyces semiglobifer]